MGRTKKVGLTGSFGARYGTAPKKKYLDIVRKMRRFHECPHCHTKSVKRKSVGIWECRKCHYTFAGGAYVPQTKLGITAQRASARAISQASQKEQLE